MLHPAAYLGGREGVIRDTACAGRRLPLLQITAVLTHSHPPRDVRRSFDHAAIHTQSVIVQAKLWAAHALPPLLDVAP